MLLGPVQSFSRSRFLISSILDPFRLNFGVLGRPQYCVFLQDRECSSSATRKFSPNPSYLLSGELVLPWDTKNRSSHTQIVHIDILRAQMYLKSDETEGTPPSEHMDIFTENIHFWHRGVSGRHNVSKPLCFLAKVAQATISCRRDDSKCHQVRSLRTKVDGGTGRGWY